MCKKMVTAIFIISFAFRTESELQIRTVKLRSATNGTFMSCHRTVICPEHISLAAVMYFKLSPPSHL